MRSGRALAGVCVVGAVFALSACGSSDKSSTSSRSSSGSTPTGSSASAPKGPAYKVALICSCSGPTAPATGRMGKVMKAWESSVNGNGGLNGHPVSVTVLDDGDNPTKALQAGKEAIAAKVAAVIDGSSQDQAFSKALTAAGIPVTGGVPYQTSMFTDPNFFPTGAVIPAVILGQVIEAKDAGKTHMGVLYCKEAPICAQLVGLVQAAASVVGGFQVTGQAISFTAPSYAPPCLALKEKGADNIFPAAVSPVVLRIAAACVQQGYEPLQVNQAAVASNSWTKDPNMDGTIVPDAQAPWFADSVPAVKEFRDALDKYAPGVTTDEQFGPTDLSPWTGAKLFEAAVKAGNLTPSSTGADVTAALYKLKDETLGGLSGPLNYVKGKPAFPSCYFVVSLTGGKFTTPKGTDAICPTQSQVVKLGALLANAGG